MDAVRAVVHDFAPHSKSAIYLLAVLSALVSIILVYVRCRLENNGKGLASGWLVKTATAAAPIPIYGLMIVAPLDPDIFEAMMTDQLVVAIAGLYGLVETLKDIRYTGRQRKAD